jgi:hypothetical protein
MTLLLVNIPAAKIESPLHVILITTSKYGKWAGQKIEFNQANQSILAEPGSTG